MPLSSTGFSLTALDWFVGSSAVLGSIWFGWYMSRKAQAGTDSSHFFLAGRNLPWWIVGLSLYATNIGAEHLVGLSGDAYRYGLKAGTVELCTAIPLGFAVAFLYPYYMKNRVFTIPEFLELRYNSAARAFFSALMLVICVMTKMAFCLYAGALVFKNLLGLEVMHTVVFLGIVTGLFTMVGGFAGVAYADIIQSIIKILGCALMTLLGLYKVGGWSGLVTKLQALHLPAHSHIYGSVTDPVYPFWGIILGAIYGGTFYWGIDQVNVQRVLGAANLREGRNGGILCIFLKFTPLFIFALPGVIAAALYPGGEPKETFVTLMNNLLPTGIRGLVLAALVCALLSSLDATMNSVSTLVVRDFVLKFKPQMADRDQVRIGRWAIVAAMGAGIGAAYLVYATPGGLYRYLQTISIYLVMPIAPAIVFGILSKRVNMTGAVASVLVGVVIAAFFVTDELLGAKAGNRLFPFLHQLWIENYTYRGFWGAVIVSLVLFGVSAFTRPTAPEKLANTTINWRARAEPFEGMLDWRLLVGLALLLTAVLYWMVW